MKAQGTDTRINDAAECGGLAVVFGERLVFIPLTSLMPTLGHCLGASGAMEADAVALSLEEGINPATLGAVNVDPALPCCNVATRLTRTVAKRALHLSESLGGRCAALVVGCVIADFKLHRIWSGVNPSKRTGRGVQIDL